MNAVWTRIAAGAALAGCALGGWAFQRGREDAADAGVAAPSPAAEMIVAGLGGFRSIAAEVVWFRADRLQDEGRYAELAQLATWLTFLEPHTPEVWAYAAWNLAYNVSVMMPTHADRWRWVEAGLRLLRDDGLRLNPRDPVIYKELAWTFLLKMGSHLDDASPFYRARWKETVAAAQASGGLADLGMDPARMAAVDAEYGALDWTAPLASALYWAHQGMAVAKRLQHRVELRQVIYQALMLESRKDPGFAPRALRELRAACEEKPSPMLRQVIENYRAQFGLD